MTIGESGASGRNASVIEGDWQAQSYMIARGIVMRKMLQRVMQGFDESRKGRWCMAAIGGVVVGFKVDLNPLGLLDCSTARIETAGKQP